MTWESELILKGTYMSICKVMSFNACINNLDLYTGLMFWDKFLYVKYSCIPSPLISNVLASISCPSLYLNYICVYVIIYTYHFFAQCMITVRTSWVYSIDWFKNSVKYVTPYCSVEILWLPALVLMYSCVLLPLSKKYKAEFQFSWYIHCLA